MESKIEIYHFKPPDAKALRKSYFSKFSCSFVVLIVTNILLSIAFFSTSLALALLAPAITLFKLAQDFKRWSKIYTSYISRIEINPIEESITIKFKNDGQHSKLTLKFKSYSILLRDKQASKELNCIDIVQSKPYKVLIRQYRVGAWEDEKGLGILKQFADKVIETEKTYKTSQTRK